MKRQLYLAVMYTLAFLVWMANVAMVLALPLLKRCYEAMLP